MFFRFLSFVQFAGFLQFSLWFSVLSAMFAVFGNFLSNASSTVFLVLLKEVTPCSRANTVIPRQLISPSTLSFRGMDDKPNMISSHYLSRIGCQADNDKSKIASK